MKEFLSRNGVKYVERDVSIDAAAAREMVARSGQRGVPVTVIDGEVVVGFDRPRLEQIIRATHVSRKKRGLGISVADVKPSAGRGTAGAQKGAYVGRVADGSTGERLGLRPGDIIVEINGEPILGVDSLERVISTLSPGDRLRVSFNRSDQWLTAEASF